MKYDDLVKQLLSEDVGEHGIDRMFTKAMGGETEHKPSFDYSAKQQKQYNPEDVDALWEQLEEVLGNAFVSSKEDIDKYLNLTNKVLIVNAYSPFAAAIPAPIAKDMVDQGQAAIEASILKYSAILREYASMAGVNWPGRAQHDTPFYITPFKDNINLPDPEQTPSNEQIAKLEKWVNWLSEKRSQSWIIANTDINNLIIE